MLNIFANSFLTATRTRPEKTDVPGAPLPRLGWRAEDLPFRRNAGYRSGYDD